MRQKKRKIGRNDPCPCGSGKKYKKCCLGKNRPRPVRRPVTSKVSVKEADGLYEAITLDATMYSMGGFGSLFGTPVSNNDIVEENIRGLMDVLALDPDHPYALMDMGLRKHAAGERAEGNALLKRGAKVLIERYKGQTEEIESMSAYAERLIDRFEYEGALILFEHLFESGTARAMALNGMATCLIFLQRSEEALAAAKEAVTLASDIATYLSNLGWIHLIRGEIVPGRKALERAVEIDPEDETARGNLNLCNGMSRKGAPEGWIDFLLKGIPVEKALRLSWPGISDGEDGDDDDDNDGYDEATSFVNEYNGRLLTAYQTHLAWRKDIEPKKKFDLFFTFNYFIKECWYHSDPWDEDPPSPLCDIATVVNRYKDMMDRLVIKTSDADKPLLDEFTEALLDFFNFLRSKRVILSSGRKKLKQTVKREYPGILKRMERYNKVRERPGVTQEEKTEARERIYPGLFW